VTDDHGPQLTVNQAADFLCSCFTREYRSLCLAHFRKLWGDDYADRVEAEVRVRFESRRR
jgi:hypothetical protein